MIKISEELKEKVRSAITADKLQPAPAGVALSCDSCGGICGYDCGNACLGSCGSTCNTTCYGSSEGSGGGGGW